MGGSIDRYQNGNLAFVCCHNKFSGSTAANIWWKREKVACVYASNALLNDKKTDALEHALKPLWAWASCETLYRLYVNSALKININIQMILQIIRNRYTNVALDINLQGWTKPLTSIYDKRCDSINDMLSSFYDRAIHQMSSKNMEAVEQHRT